LRTPPPASVVTSPSTRWRHVAVRDDPGPAHCSMRRVPARRQERRCQCASHRQRSPRANLQPAYAFTQDRTEPRDLVREQICTTPPCGYWFACTPRRNSKRSIMMSETARRSVRWRRDCAGFLCPVRPSPVVAQCSDDSLRSPDRHKNSRSKPVSSRDRGGVQPSAIVGNVRFGFWSRPVGGGVLRAVSQTVH
jgi:hypothetical protein